MDGMTMVRHIREHYPTVAIVFITGLTTARDVINGYQSGADFYSSRSLDVFITKLRKYLAKDPDVVLKVQKGAGISLEV